MPLPLPNLDDRRWADLTQEAIPLIPRYAPQWTDFNTHDPGITLLEMFAWLTESMVYQLNCVPDRFTWKFLDLIGYPRLGPHAAHVVLAAKSLPAGTAFTVPAGTQFQSAGPGATQSQPTGPAGPPILFATLRPVDFAPVTLTALQVDDGNGALRDVSRDLTDGLPFAALGNDPPVGAALYLGFTTVPHGAPVALWFGFAGPGSDLPSRERIVAEAAAQRLACRPVVPGWPCGVSPPAAPDDCDFTLRPAPAHHAAVVVWEVFAAGTWVALTPVLMPARPAGGEVVDDTRSLTLDGLVEVNLPASVTPTVLGTVTAPLTYLRVRLAAGAFDAPVMLAGVQPCAVAAAQRIALWQQIAIAGSAPKLAAPPAPGAVVSVQFVATADLTIQGLAVQSPPLAGQPGFTWLGYAPPHAGNAGSVTLAFAFLGLGTAVPRQQVFIAGAPVENRCLRLFTHDGTRWLAWQRVPDFLASHRTDLHYTLDPMVGSIVCGDGERGQVFPQSSAIVVTGYATDGAAGNVAAGAVTALAATPANAVLLATLTPAERATLGEVTTNAVAAAGGRGVSLLAHREGEAAAAVAAHERILDLAQADQQTTLDQIPRAAVLALPPPPQAVTLLDTERIALDVPGTRLARARAWPDTDPALPGLSATGVVTVVILPDMPVARPLPSAGLIAAVKRYLDRRRVLCTRIEVAAPTYLIITVTASVQARTGASTTAVQGEILAGLDAFLNPLTGGPAGLGWPFGRSVYNAEILQLIANIPGVDHVDSMTLSADGGAPQCGDIAVCPTVLVASGSHAIQVASA
jgi:hypothetical protein